MITEEYLRNIIHGKAYCPKYAEVKMLPCQRPPTVDVLLRKFHRICRDQNLVLAGVDESHIPDKRWLLDFIATLNPQDEIFKKNYLPPVKETKLSELKTISIPAHFLQDLPQSSRRSRRKGLRMQKEGIAGQKLERMKRIRKQIGDRILEEEVKNDEQSKRRSGVKTSTNESNFKNPGHHTPVRNNRGNNSGMTNGSSRSNISSIQPQSHMSPGLDQRLQSITLGLDGKK
jgi:hypothetical protein